MANQLKEELVLKTGQFDEKIDKVINKVEELKSKGKGIGGGFDKSMGGMISSVQKFSKALGAVGIAVSAAGVASWMQDTIAKSVELASAAEGIRVAFDRLNQPDLLDDLRRATHGTVDDINLMKQAVKFKDFGLDTKELGTYLAFAQQKAKDTGESIDYLVDSIVTGLGRKSLMILDNLGLSAAEIKDKMKETGDMTSAVAEIIKKRMSEAGDYAETAADRAAKKQAEYNNKLVELGETFGPLVETASNFFHSLEMGAIDALNKLRPLIDLFTELGRIRQQMEGAGGNERVTKELKTLEASHKSGKGYFSSYFHKQTLKKYDEEIEELEFRLAANKGSKDSIDKGRVARIKEEIAAIKNLKAEYVKGANKIFNPTKPTATQETTSTTTTVTNKKNLAIYKEQASTIGEITANIQVLEKRLKDVEPNSKAYKEISAELEMWRRKLQYISFDENAKSIEGIKRNIQILQEELYHLDPNSKEFEKTAQVLRLWEEKLKNVDDIIANLKFDKNAKSVDQIDKNLAILQTRLKKTIKGSQEWLELQKQIAFWSGKKKEQEDTTKVGSRQYYQNKLADVEYKLQYEPLSSEQRAELAKDKRDLEDIIALMDKGSNLGDFTKSILTGDTRTAVEQFQNLKSSVTDLRGWFEDGLISRESAEEAMKKIGQTIQEGHFPPIDLTLKPQIQIDYDKFKEEANLIFDGIYAVDNVVGSIESMVNALNEGANAWEIFMGVISTAESIINGISTVMQVATTLQALFGAQTIGTAAAKKEEAVSTAEAATANAAAATTAAATTVANKALEASFLGAASAAIFAAHAGIPFAGVAIATGLITQMIATQQAMKAAFAGTSAFANGGIVGGSSYAGDKLLARVNSGEMILNGSQQKQLFDMIDKGVTNGGAVDVNFVIKGKDLQGVLHNYNDKMSKIR